VDEPAPPGADDPFRAYHRAGARVVARRALTAAALAAVVLAPIGWASGAGGATNPALVTELALAEAQRLAVQPVAVEPPPDPEPPTGDGAVVVPRDAPTAAPAAPESAQEPPSGRPADPVAAEIAIDTVGYQEELDRCLWVKMSLTPIAPIVAAHNYCGGDVVLGLGRGDRVRLSGLELDGVYVVTGDREVRTGELVSVATEGLVADVILQTCFWRTGTTRLVTVERVA